MPVKEEDVSKPAFRAGTSRLHEFTQIPFGLSNSGSSFCHLMEMCLGDQHFLTLLLYLNDICVFAANIDEMLDRIALVFERLKTFNLKLKLQKSHFSNIVLYFRTCFLLKGFLKILIKSRIGQYQQVPRSYIPFQARLCTTGDSYPKVFSPNHGINK